MNGSNKQENHKDYGCLYIILFFVGFAVIASFYRQTHNSSTNDANQSGYNSPQFPLDNPDNDYYYDYLDSYDERNFQYDPGANYTSEPDEYSPRPTFNLVNPNLEIDYSDRGIHITGCVNISDGLNVRSGPGSTYSRVGTIIYGDCVSLIGRSEDNLWGKINSGWVSVYYLDLDGEIQQLPILEGETNGNNTYTCDCSYNRYNCEDFSGIEAQLCFDYCFRSGFGDVHFLDADDDGNACEPYP